MPSASTRLKLVCTPEPDTVGNGLPRNVKSSPRAMATSRTMTRNKNASSTARSASS
jgi:hypothetical protein